MSQKNTLSLPDRLVTLYKNGVTSQALDYLRFEDLISIVRDGKYRPAVERIRAEEDKAKRQELKKRVVPAASISGTFSPRRANSMLQQHSGLLRLDLDDVEDKAATKRALCAAPHTLALWDSVSGPHSNGLCPIVHFTPIPTTPEEHRIAFEAARMLYGLPSFDEIVKDVSRLTFLSYDAELFVNWEARPIEVDYSRATRTAFAVPASRIVSADDLIPDGHQYHAAQVLAGSMVRHGFTANQTKTALHAVLGTHGADVRDPSLLDKLADDIAGKGFDPEQHYSTFVANVVRGTAREEDLRAFMLPDASEIAGDGLPGGAPSIRGSKAVDEEDDPLALDAAPPLAEEVYELLPPVLQKATGTFTQHHERDVMLTAALSLLASCMPNVRGYYGHNAELLSPNIYVALIAGAAGGKGVMRWAERLVFPVDEYLREDSDRERARWAERKELASETDQVFDEPEPPKQSLRLPANTSTAALHKALADRGGRAYIFETEIDTFVNANGQEWGRTDDSLRKAFHHETISYLRKNEEVSIADPCISVVLSGTPDQQRSLIQSAENGLYSRIAMYYFVGKASWVDQRPSSDAATRRNLFDRLGLRIKEMYLELAARQNILLFEMQPRHWDQHRDTFGPFLRKLYAEGHGHLDDVVKRAGVIAFRLVMTLAVLRVLDTPDTLDTSLRGAVRLRATDDDVNAALILACTYADHALRFSKTLAVQPTPNPRAIRLGKLLNELETEFSNEDVYDVAASSGLDVTERTLRRDLDYAARQGLLVPLKKSHWRQSQ